MNKARRIQFLIGSVPYSSSRRFASFSSNSAANPRILNFSSEEDETEEGGSRLSVYSHALRHQRPSTIRQEPQLQNSVSFIGSVDLIPKLYKTKGHTFGVYTFINLINSGDPNRKLRMQLEMWGDIAKVAIQHLKRNDAIYVSGRLGSYKNADEDGNVFNYKVIVREFSYVAQLGQQSNFQKHEESLVEASQNSEQLQSKASDKSEELLFGEASSGESGVEKHTNHLHLWELFFCKPYEWWDKRKSEQNLSAPDFKHKHTGQCLWLRPDDPPWVHKQLQLLDMERAKQRQANGVVHNGLDWHENRHYLWQVFFSNPHEWWDNRKNKKHSEHPDFKHKDTGEAIWIRPNDPPWVKKQLQLLDSIKKEQCLGVNVDSQSQVSKWLADD